MPRPVLGPPPYHLPSVEDTLWRKWFNEVFDRFGGIPFGIEGSTVANLPAASNHGATTGNPFTSLIFVSDETGGATIAFSDGTDWRRVQDRAIVS